MIKRSTRLDRVFSFTQVLRSFIRFIAGLTFVDKVLNFIFIFCCVCFSCGFLLRFIPYYRTRVRLYFCCFFKRIQTY